MQELSNPIALQGFKYDKEGLDWCDTCILLLPCGKSAHLEAGYAIGQGKPTLVVLHTDRFEPELMYLLAGSPAYVVSDLSCMLEGLDALPAGETTITQILAMEVQRNEWAMKAAGLLIVSENLVKLGAAMRKAQKDYFRTRHPEALARSKKLEGDFDRLLAEATATEKQGSLM